ncbi:MAG: rod shape-determining protein RodA [Lentisphaeria bacterium]|nr:rod shape-determining protein RodA [Lentisphaeria bacterium]
MGKFFSRLKPDVRQDETPEHPVSSLLKDFAGRFDWFQIVPMFLLLTIGALFIYGTGQQVGGIHAALIWKKQLLFMGIGIVIWFFLIFFDYRWLIPGTFVIYPVSLVLLVAVLFFGTELYGAKRWLSIGGFSYQPSELAKLGVILVVSFLLSRRKADINKPLWALGVVSLTAVPFLLIYKEPDLGTALVLLPIVGAILFAAHLKLRWILALLVLLLATAPILYMNLKPYQKERIEAFLHPENLNLSGNYQVWQSKVAIGNGGFTGTGLFNGTQKELDFIPVQSSDFIFSVIGEELGFIGGLIIIAVFGIMLYRMATVVRDALDFYGALVVSGVIGMFTFQIFENIAMTMGIMPVTGITLPFLSYGGSSILSNMAAFGIVLDVGMRSKSINF